VKRYSSGMYVRLAFAVAAHLEPEILVVDEVLAVGDASFQKKCLGKMESVSEVTGRTVLFVSHNLAAISKLCTSAIALASGSAICRGRVDACIKHYLLTSAGSSQGTALAWSNKSIDLAQGIALHSCGCSQVESSDSSTLRDDKEISIWINLIIKKPMQDFQVALILVNENGEIIIHTQTDASEHFVISQQSANSSIIYRVPRGTFKRGMYFVSVYGVIPNVTRIFAHEDIIRFIVEPSSSAVTRHASSAWRGALSPCFGEWAEGKHAHIPL
jgi:lipopolysaccharide transport system ATP-binding protein